MKDHDIFSERERRLLYFKKPELRPVKVPSLNDANTIRVPSLNDANLLTQPSIDQIIIEFLKQYDVNVEPRSVGAWNGWDTLSAASALSTAIFAERGTRLDIASTLFMANRSNQVNSAAQDWGTWKRWALDHKNFDQYKDEVIQTINFHNENATKEVEEAIRQAELHNKNAIKEIKNSIREAELHNENLCKRLQDPEIKEYVSQLVENDNLAIANLKEKRSKIAIQTTIVFFSIIAIFSIGNFSYRKIQKVINNKNQEKVIPLKQQAQKFIIEKNFANALLTYEKALKITPNDKSLILIYARTIFRYHQATNTKPSCVIKKALQQISRDDLQWRGRVILNNRVNVCSNRTGWGSEGFKWR